MNLYPETPNIMSIGTLKTTNILSDVIITVLTIYKFQQNCRFNLYIKSNTIEACTCSYSI